MKENRDMKKAKTMLIKMICELCEFNNPVDSK